MSHERLPDLARVVEVALREAAEIEKVEADLRRALEDGDEALALTLARRLVGLPSVRSAA